jgi:hypothetical protein
MDILLSNGSTDHLIVPPKKTKPVALPNHLDVATVLALPIVTAVPEISALRTSQEVQVEMNGDRSVAELNALFRDLRALIKACGSGASKHEVVTNVIVACIMEGINQGVRIVGVLKRLKFDGKHAAMTLHHVTNGPLTRTLWRQDEAGLYHLIN